jgi:hypothetical protein
MSRRSEDLGFKVFWITSFMPFRDVNTETMQSFLAAPASKLRRRADAVMILDGAGWHCAHKLRWPRRITPLFLPPYSPELNPVERLWHWLREHHWSNRAYLSVDKAVFGNPVRHGDCPPHTRPRREPGDSG